MAISIGDSVRLVDLPPYLPAAVLATEDRRFYSHCGVDLRGVARALYVNAKEGDMVQGGSTITQQVAKNLFLTPERSLHRKGQEMLLALWLERTFTKDQILELYLNRVYFGAGAYGVDAAAKKYFGRSARDVTIFQAAMLAGLLKAPSRFNPFNDQDLAKTRGRAGDPQHGRRRPADRGRSAGDLRKLPRRRCRRRPATRSASISPTG